MRSRKGVPAVLAVATLALCGSLVAALVRADGVIPHSDPIVAAKQMRHGGPLPQSISPNPVTTDEQWRRYQEDVTAATERAIHDRFKFAGPWEAIAAQEFGVTAKPEANGWTAMPVPSSPSPSTAPPPSASAPNTPAHSPVRVLPIPPAVAASPAPSPSAVPTAAATVQTPGPTPSSSPAPWQKPTLPHDTVMRLIRKYTELIAQYRAKRVAEEDKAKRIAAAAAAWAAANPPKHHQHGSAEPPGVPAPHHHRFGLPTHKRPPLPTHAMQTPSEAKRARRVQFALKFVGVCVDNATATAMGKHANPHTHQPMRHHTKYHRRGADATAEPSREVPYCSLKAQSQEIVTRIHPNAGVDMRVTKMIGSVARLDLFDLSILSETEFVARGNISFGSTRHKSHSVAMESAGSARVFKFKTGERAFTGQFQVTDGGGGFEGHRGLVTLNAVWSSPTRVEALVTGSLYPPEDLNTNAHRVSALKPSPFYRRSGDAKQHQQPMNIDSAADDDGDGDCDHDDDANSKAKPKGKAPIHLRV